MGKKVREWKVEEKRLSPLQRGFIIAIIAFIPFFIFILLPHLIRNYIVDKLKLAEELIVAPPEHVALVSTGEVPPTMRIVIRNFTFQIPRIYTPVRISSDLAVFRINARRISRTISIAALEQPTSLSLHESGLLQWFMPSDPLAFLDTILYASYHPVRMLCKAHFYVGEGIGSKVFETSWDANHRAYVFPTPGGSGYVGRIYRTNGPGYYEFSMIDEVDAVTLREWINLAIKLKPPFQDGTPQQEVASRGASLAAALAKCEQGDSALSDVIETSLNQYFATGKQGWLLPIAKVMEKRGYYNELVQFYRNNVTEAGQDLQQQALWKDLFDRTLPQIIKIDVDPHLNQNQIDLYCKNICEFAIRRVKLKLTLSSREGDKTFETLILNNDTLHPGNEKVVSVEPPAKVV
ncbi:MAG TPA: hypothetical protein PKM25_05630, partial [Candidatus Ozemobacteraceae bacterium]|nr:hypothetical protein [Candidatus Ozemobacteraceae bacterium]